MKQGLIARVGDKLPDINIIFLGLTIVVIVASFFLAGVHHFSAVAPVEVKNLFSIEGMGWAIQNLQTNFITFSPLALTLVAVIGTGVAEKTGLFGALIKKVGIAVPGKILIPMVVFLGVMSSLASDVGYIILVPLAGVLFAGLNKNPVLGMLAAFAGVSAGFGANLFPTPGDAILGGMTFDAMSNAGIVGDFGLVTMNLYFMIASTFLLTLVGWFVTVKFIAPKFVDRPYVIPEDIKDDEAGKLSDIEKKGLKNAGIALILFLLAVLIIYIFGYFKFYVGANGDVVSTFFSNASNVAGGLKAAKPVNLVLDYLIIFMVVAFLLPGYVYGVTTGKIKTSKDYIQYTIDGFKTNASVILVAFFAGNFIAFFNYSGIGNLIASTGADLLQSSGLSEQPILLLIVFIFLAAFINLFMGSASAKWALLAPIFIPLLYNANPNITPDIIQAAYRVADSSTNIISPLMTYMPIVVVFVQRFDKKFNIGTMIEMMYKYSIGFLIPWIILFVVFYVFNIPFGF